MYDFRTISMFDSATKNKCIYVQINIPIFQTFAYNFNIKNRTLYR